MAHQSARIVELDRADPVFARIRAEAEDDWNRRGRRLCHQDRSVATRHDHGNLTTNQIGDQRRAAATSLCTCGGHRFNNNRRCSRKPGRLP